MKSIVVTLFIIFLINFPIIGQEKPISPDPDLALALFEQGNYREALPLYQILFERYERDAKINYYLGVCLVEQQQNFDEAINHLKYALTKRVNKDANYYLGRAYQHTYQYDLAIKSYENFLRYAANNDPRRELTKRAIQDCESGKQLINKYFTIKVLRKDTVDEAQFIEAYQFPQECGTLARNESFFKTGVPPKEILYRTEKGNEVYFVLEESGDSIHDIYKMEKLLDQWSSSKNLGIPVNSDFDDKYPFLMVDGTTFFFSSDRPGGMGGLDIYRSIYDPESNTFSEPENVGPPFNSPADDYLFAADPFGKQAWFTTNRGVEPGKAVVVKIVWDHQVIKNLAESAGQIRELASLPLASGNLWTKKQTQQPIRLDEKVSSVKEFVFHINDTIVYTNYQQFRSDVARAEFKRGQQAELEKDSLTQLLRIKRKQYAESYNQEELTRLMDEILNLEQKVYGQDDRAKRHLIRARQLEIEKISQLIKDGKYIPPIKKDNDHSTSSRIKFQPKEMTFYSDEEFIQRKKKMTPVYNKLFSPAQIKILQNTDSIYTWANILKLEAAKLMEKSVNNQEDEPKSNSFFEKIKKTETQDNDQSSIDTEQLIKKAKELQKTSLDLYHEALDKKYSIYRPKLELLSQNPDYPQFQTTFRKAHSYFEDANNQLAQMAIWNPEKYEYLAAMKREAVEMIEDEFLDYTSKHGFHLPDKTNTAVNNGPKSTHIQPNYQTIQNSRSVVTDNSTDIKTNNAEEIIKSAFSKASTTDEKNNPATENSEKNERPIFKIQIGVFRNNPDPNLLAELPDVSSEPIAGKNLTKYFAGNYSTYEEAFKQINTIQQKGFTGAFIVAFFNGKQIPVSEAQQRIKSN